MKIELLSDICDEIRFASTYDGVKCKVLTSGIRDKGIVTGDIELIYNNYYYIERFNEGMNISEEDVKSVALSLLTSLFRDYFKSKINH